jgi:hypothetical protein
MVKHTADFLDDESQLSARFREPDLVESLKSDGVIYEIRANILGHPVASQTVYLIETGSGLSRRFIFEGVVWFVAAPQALDTAGDAGEFAGVPDFSICQTQMLNDSIFKLGRLGLRGKLRTYVVALPGVRWKIDCLFELKSDSLFL